jgi:hypothetical protein
MSGHVFCVLLRGLFVCCRRNDGLDLYGLVLRFLAMAVLCRIL